MISFEEFKRRKLELKYRGTEEDIKREYDVYVEAIKPSEEPQVRTPQAPDNNGAGVSECQLSSDSIDPPGLAVFFNILAVLSLIGGLVLAMVFWPGDPGYGNEWRSSAYIWSIAWASLSVVEAGIFSAIGSVLSYLHIISINTAK